MRHDKIFQGINLKVDRSKTCKIEWRLLIVSRTLLQQKINLLMDKEGFSAQNVVIKLPTVVSIIESLVPLRQL